MDIIVFISEFWLKLNSITRSAKIWELCEREMIIK